MKNTVTKNFYSAGKNSQRDKYFAKYKNSDGTTNLMVNMINGYIKVLHPGSTILDIGTGNGFLINEVFTNNKNRKLKFIGLDNSEAMLEAAKVRSNKAIELILGDNHKLPFDNESIDLVVAKAVTSISPEEVHRVLKPGGRFVYKEYRAERGLKKLSKSFGKRFIYNNTYINVLNTTVDIFSEVNVSYFNIPMELEKNQVVELLLTMRLIKSPSVSMIRGTLEREFPKQSKIEIVSDPFIINAIK